MVRCCAYYDVPASGRALRPRQNVFYFFFFRSLTHIPRSNVIGPCIGSDGGSRPCNCSDFIFLPSPRSPLSKTPLPPLHRVPPSFDSADLLRSATAFDGTFNMYERAVPQYFTGFKSFCIQTTFRACCACRTEFPYCFERSA